MLSRKVSDEKLKKDRSRAYLAKVDRSRLAEETFQRSKAGKSLLE